MTWGERAELLNRFIAAMEATEIELPGLTQEEIAEAVYELAGLAEKEGFLNP